MNKTPMEAFAGYAAAQNDWSRSINSLLGQMAVSLHEDAVKLVDLAASLNQVTEELESQLGDLAERVEELEIGMVELQIEAEEAND